MNKKVIIIGAGFGGLSAAAFLAKAGFDVTVLEKNEQPGGRAMYFESKGFKFDMGPSWYMMPHLFDEFFEKLGEKRSDYYKVQKLNPNYKVFFHDGTQFDITTNLEKTIDIFERIERGSGEKLVEYLKSAKFKYEKTFNSLGKRNFRNIFSLFNKEILLNLFKLGFLESWQKNIESNFRDKRLQQILSWHSVFVGGSPKTIPSFYTQLTYVDFMEGIFYPERGFQGVVESILKVAQKYGARFEFSEEVSKILVREGKATGVETVDGKLYEADIVIGNADYHHIETELLEEKDRSYSSKYWESRKLAPATLCIYLGISKKLERLSHHNYVFSKHWDEHFDDMFVNPKWPKDPSIYICIPSKTDPTVAPAEGENIFALIPVAPGLDDSNEIRKEFLDLTIQKIEDISGENISDFIITKSIISQREHADLFNAYKGNGLGIAHTLFQTGPFRPAIKSKKVNNLYFSGQYTQPGTSTVICLISGEIVANEIIKDAEKLNK